ncbi:hypothetical protein [Pseudoalteromonas ruthenica]|uniref:hypothetical protein n=1 Tax=Pseudoalteromonas ruthenica TaxID=151081 RepID=UPI0006976B95|nr:hypothetical protein [Pseudoalteromonas ruthenica]TMO84912.1 hypothetical protein CWC12_17925 [Pseudoalteromonas ruthenica]TMO92229.1 hypothetical protein CWC13_11525 [Pseudoalteromonas ruthenica]TMO96856.1 hypothetical protein CWC07_16105 [Pseudoalteromonas ruthenica]TMP07660.1 hypothetical protein CWC09_09545 [Pseudoalteromonas ruthenica]TMP10818.1 hypothetical protein CWC08_06620 [Pseudoalteromonas ruthenica]
MKSAVPIFLILFLLCGSASAKTVRYIEPFFGDATSDNSFHIQVLKRALSLSEAKFGAISAQAIDTPMLQGRQFRALARADIDVLWSMTSRARELEARPIRIPLTMGLIGYRVFVIKQRDRHRFATLTSKAQLQQLLALQGHDWPDTEIMSSNGFKVRGVSWHQSMYKLLAEDKFDYFPRGVLEIGAEGEGLAAYALSIDSKWVLHYPAASYFFVRHEDTSLAQRLEYGLAAMLQSGELKAMILNNPHHVNALRMLNFSDREFIRLDNPLLPDSTPTLDPKYWLTPQELSELVY